MRSAALSIVSAICASFACVSWKSPRTPPNILREVARAIASSKARRAKPSAAAATEVRKTSSVRIATLKPSPSAPMRLRRRNAAAGEAQAGERVRRDDVDALGDREAGRVGVDDEGADAARALRRRIVLVAGAREDDVEVGDAAVRDPGLLAVEDVAVAVGARRARHRGDVGAGVGLGERERGDRLAARHARQVARLLLGACRRG